MSHFARPVESGILDSEGRPRRNSLQRSNKGGRRICSYLRATREDHHRTSQSPLNPSISISSPVTAIRVDVFLCADSVFSASLRYLFFFRIPIPQRSPAPKPEPPCV